MPVFFSQRQGRPTGTHFVPPKNSFAVSNPSSAASAAASHAFLARHPASTSALSAAAAAATLKTQQVGPPTEPGNVTTKRMLASVKKRSSASPPSFRSASTSSLSSTHGGMVNKSLSRSGSGMSDRTLRATSPGAKRSTSVRAPPVPKSGATAIPGYLLSKVRPRSSSVGQSATHTTRPSTSGGPPTQQQGASFDTGRPITSQSNSMAGAGAEAAAALHGNAQAPRQPVTRQDSTTRRSVNFSRPISPQSSTTPPSKLRRGGWFTGGQVTGEQPRGHPRQSSPPTPPPTYAQPPPTMLQRSLSAQSNASQRPIGLGSSRWSPEPEPASSPMGTLPRGVQPVMTEKSLPPVPSEPVKRSRTATIAPAQGPGRNSLAGVYVPQHMLPAREPSPERPVEDIQPAELPASAPVVPLPVQPRDIKTSRFTEHVTAPTPNHLAREPPNRTASPVKSAMKQPSPSPNYPQKLEPPADDNVADSLDSKRKKSVRINVEMKPEDETPQGAKASRYAPPTPIPSRINFDEQIDDIMKPRATLPSFGSVRSERETSPPGLLRESLRDVLPSNKGLPARTDVARTQDSETLKFATSGAVAAVAAKAAESSSSREENSLKDHMKQSHMASEHPSADPSHVPGSFPDDESDSDESIYADAEEEITFTSLDAILEEPTPMEEADLGSGKGKGRAIESSSILEDRLEEARLNSKRIEEPDIKETEGTPGGPKLMTSKWSPLNAPASPTEQVASPLSDQPRPLVRQGSADSASSFKRSRATTRPPTSGGKTTLRSSLRGADSRARTVSPPAMRPSLRATSPSGGSATGSFSGHRFRSSLRGGPGSDSSSFTKEHGKWKLPPARLPSFLKRPKHKRSSSETGTPSPGYSKKTASTSRFTHDSDEETEVPQKSFVSRFKDDSDEDLPTPSPIVQANEPSLMVQPRHENASSTGLEGENGSRLSLINTPAVPSTDDINRMHGVSGLASSKYATVVSTPPTQHKRWQSIFNLGHARRSGSFSNLSRPVSQHSDNQQSDSRPGSSYGADLDPAIRPTGKLRRKSKNPPVSGETQKPIASRSTSYDGARDNEPQIGTRAMLMGKRRSTADELLGSRVLDLLKTDENAAVSPAPVELGGKEIGNKETAHEKEESFLTPRDTNTPEPKSPLDIPNHHRPLNTTDTTPAKSKKRFSRWKNIIPTRHRK